MTLPTYEEFESTARARGYDEVLVREWAPGLVLATHTHSFGVDALVVRGRFSLSAGGATAHLQAGDRFQLEPEAPHGEAYGPEGATFWVARRHSPA